MQQPLFKSGSLCDGSVLSVVPRLICATSACSSPPPFSFPFLAPLPRGASGALGRGRASTAAAHVRKRL